MADFWSWRKMRCSVYASTRKLFRVQVVRQRNSKEEMQGGAPEPNDDAHAGLFGRALDKGKEAEDGLPIDGERLLCGLVVAPVREDVDHDRVRLLEGREPVRAWPSKNC